MAVLPEVLLPWRLGWGRPVRKKLKLENWGCVYNSHWLHTGELCWVHIRPGIADNGVDVLLVRKPTTTLNTTKSGLKIMEEVTRRVRGVDVGLEPSYGSGGGCSRLGVCFLRELHFLNR